MNYLKFKYVLVLIVFRFETITCLISSQLPKHLVPCYNGSLAMEKIPLTFPLLIELIRKIELYDETTVNLRILTTALLHQAIFDGVLKSDNTVNENGALPFRARGHEFYKYKLVVDYLVSGESTLMLNESLSQIEICYLHNMLSSSTSARRRGDEEVTCSYVSHNKPVPALELSSEFIHRSQCPLVKGNINSKWGTLNAGHLVYGASAALQNTRTSFSTIIQTMNKTRIKDTVSIANSSWISTIAGDLAEVVLNQANRNMKMGSLGFWNDTLLPVAYYLSDYFTELTEAKVIGGIDGLIIASNIGEWEKILMKTRFSQILDMYYSNRGVAYNPMYKASNRNSIFNSLLQNTNLTKQVIGTAKMLREIGTYDTLLSDNDIEELATFITDKFEDLAEQITKHYDTLGHVSEDSLRSNLEIILILDGSLDFYKAKQLVNSLSESSQISIYNSKLGIINGQTGEWISNTSGEILGIFRDLEKAQNSWPTELSLRLSFERIMAHYQNSTRNNCTGYLNRPLGRAIVVISENGRPTDIDISKSKEALYSIKMAYPETNIIYVSSSKVRKSFETISNLFPNDTILEFSHDVLTLSSTLTKRFYDIPSQIVNIYCEDTYTRMEDYLTPEEEKFYEIFMEYTRRYNFELKFKGYGYGDIFICANSQSAILNETCRKITVNDEVSFNSRDLCSGDSRCNPQFILRVNNSKFHCAENDCRYPDQVRLGITWTKSGSGFFLVNSAYLVFAFLLTRFNIFI